MATRPKFAVAVSHQGRPVPCDWHLAMKMLLYPTNTTHYEMWRKGMLLDDAMNDMTDDAISRGCEFIWFVDDDTQPPPDAIMKLLAALEQDPEAMACGGIYTTKRNPPEPLVYKERGAGPYWNWKVGEVFPCWATGNGCLMVRTEVFRHMPRPWWKWINTTEELLQFADIFPDGSAHKPKTVSISPDIYFFSRLEQMGMKALAHGGVLPIHHAGNGKTFWIPRGSYPAQGIMVGDEEYGWVDPDIKPELDIRRALNVNGWMSPPELRWLAREAKRHKCIVEIGSFLGRSTLALAVNTPGKVYCVDDWQGPRGYPLSDYDRANLLNKFKQNVNGLLEAGKVIVCQNDLQQAYPIIEDKPDMVFVDGDHETESVRRDILWAKEQMPEGLLCGHDIDIPEIREAINSLHLKYDEVPNTTIWVAR